MKLKAAILAAYLLTASPLLAVPVTLFKDTDTFIKRSQDIVIAKCVSFPDGRQVFEDGFRPVNVEVLKTLKGNKKLGALRIATIYPLEVGKTYLLASMGGMTMGTDFLAVPELSVVPIPADFDLDQLQGKNTKEQLHLIFARRLHEVERQLAPLLKQQKLLQQSIKDKQDDQFEREQAWKFRKIKKVTSTESGGIISLDLEAGPLQWSSSTPGETGFYYFADHLPETPDWEFAYSDVKDLKEFQGKQIAAKFYGELSPDRDKRLTPNQRGNAVWVKRGQVMLVRAADKPDTIYLVQIDEQSETDVKVRYAVVHR